MTILSTRLHRPIISDNYLKRIELFKRLDEGKNRSLIMVVASAGYGKSVLISQWLQIKNIKNSWISIESDCNDFRLFLEYLSNAIQMEYPDSMQDSLDMVNSIDLPPYHEVLAIIINDLNKISGDLHVIFDDFHLIQKSEIHNIIRDLINEKPSRIHFLLITRHDPPIKLGKLRAYGQLSELRISDLMFSKQEIFDFARIENGTNLSVDLVALIKDLTEGWIIGIRLLLHELRSGRTNFESLFQSTFKQNFLSSYFLEEIFEEKSKVLQNALMIASLFDRFNVELIEEVYSFEIESTIDKRTLVRTELWTFLNNAMFVIPLSEDSKWFRFHDLVKKFLRNQFDKYFNEDIREKIYLEASSYFNRNKNLEEAIDCAIKGGGIDRAVTFMSKNWDELLLRDQYARIERWLDQLPEWTTLSYPDLLVLKTRINESQVDYVEMRNSLDALKLLLEPYDLKSENARKLWGEYHALESAYCYFKMKISSAVDHAEIALELLTGMGSYFYDYAMLYKALALLVTDKSMDATDLFERHISQIPKDYRLGLMRAHSYLPILYIYQAKIDKLIRSAKLSFHLSNDEKAWVSHVMASYYLINVHYIQNELENIENYIESLSKHRRGGRPMWVAHSLYCCLNYFLAIGEEEKMKETLEEISAYLGSFNLNNFDDLIYSMKVEMALRLNNLKEAEIIAQKCKFNSLPVIFSFYFTQLTKVKLLLSREDEGSMKEAYALLFEYEMLGLKNRNFNFLIQVYALKALWFNKKNKNQEAIESLKKSLELAREGKYIRIYIDFGIEMYALFNQLSAIEKEDEYISDVLNVFVDERSKKEAILINESRVKPSKNSNFLLNKKETEILTLVQLGYQNKEIANKLCLSPETIKKYLYYTYIKLGVKNRTAAVSKALDLNLLLSSV